MPSTATARWARIATLTMVSAVAYAPASHSFFNPFSWMDGDRYDDDYYGHYGGPGPYGYGPPGYAPGYAGPYGGGPGYFGHPGFYGAPGYYGAPGVGGNMPAAPTRPAESSGSDQTREIEALKRRIEELEADRQPRMAPPALPGATDWPSSPAFRPQDGY